MITQQEATLVVKSSIRILWCFTNKVITSCPTVRWYRNGHYVRFDGDRFSISAIMQLAKLEGVSVISHYE